MMMNSCIELYILQIECPCSGNIMEQYLMLLLRIVMDYQSTGVIIVLIRMCLNQWKMPFLAQSYLLQLVIAEKKRQLFYINPQRTYFILKYMDLTIIQFFLVPSESI